MHIFQTAHAITTMCKDDLHINVSPTKLQLLIYFANKESIETLVSQTRFSNLLGNRHIEDTPDGPIIQTIQDYYAGKQLAYVPEDYNMYYWNSPGHIKPASDASAIKRTVNKLGSLSEAELLTLYFKTKGEL